MGSPEKRLLDSIRYLSKGDQKEVARALERAKELHGDQKRASGELFVTHPVEVALYLAKIDAGKETIIAALLHDTVEDECISLKAVEDEFGSVVTKLVDGITKLSKLKYEGKREERQLASLRKMLLTANDDLRVIFIKLADRWHNITTIDALPQEKQERIALETLDIYVPFARLVGLWELKCHLETMCFPLAYPKESSEWHKAIEKVRRRVEKERTNFVHRVNSETTDDVKVAISEMTDYELYLKLQGNINRLEDVNLVDSCLVMCDNPNAKPIDCYRVLGEIHEYYPVLIGSFRDFISTPKPNGYAGLHTTIFLSRNHQFRLRIQTEKMYEYASERKLSEWVTGAGKDICTALTSLHHGAFQKEEYMKGLKETVLEERINVFTTAGEIVALPHKATGVDFAFAVSPGNLTRLAGVKVNGEPRQATYTLQEGDTVDLILVENGKKDVQTLWLEKMKSIDAKEKIKSSLKRSPKQKRVDLGRNLLEVECGKHHLPEWALFNSKKIHKPLLAELGIDKFDDLLEGLGTGVISLSSVIDAYKHVLSEERNWFISFMKLFGLFPHERVINRDAAVMDIEVLTEDRTGMIFDLTKCFADRNINISSFRVYAVPPLDALYKIGLEVKNYEEFSDLYDALLAVPNVKNILRKS